MRMLSFLTVSLALLVAATVNQPCAFAEHQHTALVADHAPPPAIAQTPDNASNYIDRTALITTDTSDRNTSFAFAATRAAGVSLDRNRRHHRRNRHRHRMNTLMDTGSKAHQIAYPLLA
jgi:hypothetical protein